MTHVHVEAVKSIKSAAGRTNKQRFLKNFFIICKKHLTERTAKAQALSCKRFDREADEDHLGVTYRKESGDSVIVKREALYRQSKQGGTALKNERINVHALQIVVYGFFYFRDSWV